MSDWTSKQAVADEILAIVNETRYAHFSLDDVYAREDVFQQRFPRNRHVRDKVRQTLQRLRDAGLVNFLGGGNYELNAQFDDLVLEPTTEIDDSILLPRTTTVVRQIRLRNTLLACDLKQRNDHICQVCHSTVRLVNRDYAEAHHIRPLGSPHLGSDVEGNIVVVCPNHHVMFDRGTISIDVDSLMVRHVEDAFEPRTLITAPWHKLDVNSLSYYHDNICGV